MSRATLAIAFALLTFQVTNVMAGGPCSGVKGGCGRSSYRSTPSYSYRADPPAATPKSKKKDCSGSTSVKGHYRDGKWVEGHTRCTSGSSSSSSASSYRSTARSETRTKAWNGTSSTYDDEDEVKPGHLAPVRRHTPEPLPARFFVILTTGRRVPAIRVSKKDDDYVVDGVTGSQATYPKRMVKTVEKVPDAPTPVVQSIVDKAALAASKIPGTDGLPTSAIVKRVVDGDTIELDDGDKVRLIGIDTPETVHPSKPVERFGREAKAFTTGMLEGQQIVLVYDQANSAIGHRDKYDRLLAYVYRADGLDFNAVTIKKGYAHAYTDYPFKRMDEFRRYETEAREQQLGLWAPDDEQAPRPPPSSTVNRPARAGLLDRSQAEDRRKVEAEEMTEGEQTDSASEGGYWITSSSGVRHNSGCRYYRNSKGHECGPNDGRACKICGG